MSFSDDLDPDIIQEVSEDYKKAAYWLPFTAVDIEKIFNEEQLEELGSFIIEVKSARNSNKKKAKSIEKHSSIVLKLLKMAKVV